MLFKSFNAPSDQIRSQNRMCDNSQAIVGAISNFAKSAVLFLAATISSNSTVSAQPVIEPADFTIHPADSPDNTVKLSVGYIFSTKDTLLDTRFFIFPPNNTDEPYNSIVGGSYHLDFFRDNIVGLVLQGENISLTPAFRLPGAKGPDLNMFNSVALAGRLIGSDFKLSTQLGISHLDPTNFTQINTTIIAPFIGVYFHVSNVFQINLQGALPFDSFSYISEDISLDNQDPIILGRISAEAVINIQNFSLSAQWLIAKNPSPNQTNSFMFGLSYEPGRTQANQHTTRYSAGYNLHHPVTGSGPTFEAIAVHRPASLQSEETQNTNVAGSLDTLQESCKAIGIEASNALDITTWKPENFNTRKLRQYLDCQEISSFTLDLTQLDNFNKATIGRSGFKLTLNNSTTLKGKALADALLKIPAIATADITFAFEIDPLAKFETLKVARNTEQPQYHLSSHPDILFTESEQRFIQGGNDFNLDSAQHLFDRSKLPYANPKTKTITFGNDDGDKITADNALIHKGFVYSINVEGQTYKVHRILGQNPSLAKVATEEFMSVTYTGDQACTLAGHEHAPYLQTAVKAFAPILDQDITMLVGHHGGISFQGYTQGEVTLQGGSSRTQNEILNQAGKLSLEKTATTALFQATNKDDTITLKISLSYDATMNNPEFTITWKKSSQ